jgi:eukaryotic-like serine/threonine-protein kinase
VDATPFGHYQLQELIGRGGMGEVWRAYDTKTDRIVALKVLPPHMADDETFQQRFRRESQAAAGINEPHVVPIHGFGEIDGRLYLDMRLIDGRNLGTILNDTDKALAPSFAVHVAEQVGAALDAAHEAGLIHRDIKPSNVIVAASGGIKDQAKLLDFGLVLPPAGSGAPGLTREGQVLGTPLFMAPEQATGDARVVDGRSDLYALGAVAYYLLTGRPPFEGDDGLAVLIAHARDPVVPPSRVWADIPEDLERVVLRCLAKAPAERFPDAESLERALGACSCAGEWGPERASRWWHDASRIAAATPGVH